MVLAVESLGHTAQLPVPAAVAHSPVALWWAAGALLAAGGLGCGQALRMDDHDGGDARFFSLGCACPPRHACRWRFATCCDVVV